MSKYTGLPALSDVKIVCCSALFQARYADQLPPTCTDVPLLLVAFVTVTRSTDNKMRSGEKRDASTAFNPPVGSRRPDKTT